MKYKFLPYDKNLVSRARELRSRPTESEKFFWDKILKSEELKELTFLRQKPLGPFIVDFYCSKARIAIEIDGEVHDSARDKERDNILKKSFDINIIRYTNESVMKDTDKIKSDFLRKISLIKEG